MKSRTLLAALLLLVSLGVFLAAQVRQPSHGSEWPAYGGGPDQIRYSPLTQINATNVADLAVAWTYDTGETGGLQTQPLVVDGVLYGYTPTHKTFALHAATGEKLWVVDSGIKGRGANRGVMYWSRANDRRVYAGGVGSDWPGGRGRAVA